jgi:prevent-host-death family protein
MKSIRVRDLEQQPGDVLLQVRDECAEFEVTDQGRVIARIVPADEAETASPTEAGTALSLDEFRAEWDRASHHLSERWPKGVSAVDAVREQPRDL